MKKVTIIKVPGKLKNCLIPNVSLNDFPVFWIDAKIVFVWNFSDFVFWYVPQIQYKNPNVQILSLKNMTPSPFIRCFYGKLLRWFILCWDSYLNQANWNLAILFTENGKELLIDIDSKKKEEILAHCLRTIGKSR